MIMIQCPDVPWEECLEMKVADDNCALTPSVQIFQLLQSGLVFLAFVAGVTSLTHLLCYRFWRCNNSSTLAAIIMIGICHLISCIYRLQMSQNASIAAGINGCNTGQCVDYYTSSMIANSLVIAIILCNVIMNSSTSKSRGVVFTLCYLFPVFIGLYMAVQKPWSDYGDHISDNNSIMSVGQHNQTHLDVFLSICPTSLSSDRFRLWYEYSLIYLPGVVVVIIAWCTSNDDSKDTLMKLPVLSSRTCVSRMLCSCNNLKLVLSTIVIYSGVILLHVRPVFILYAHATTGYFRDMLPSLLQTTMYSFLCFEYISKVIFGETLTKKYFLTDRKILYV